MKRSEIITSVNKKTEQALVDQIDFNDLLLEVEQEFCGEQRFWWRKKRFTFQTVAGTGTYDLTDTANVTTTPANIGPFVEEISFVGRVDGTNICELDPIFDDQAIAEWDVDSSQGQPGLYTIESNDAVNSQILRLHKIPSAVFTVHVFAWMMPNLATDSSDDVIYIVPPIWHHALKTGLEREVWRLKYGEQDPKFVTANALYEKKVAAAKVKPAFSTERNIQWRRDDGRAVRSTR